MIPIFILHTWLLGFLSLGILGGACYLGHQWQVRSWAWDESLQRSVFAPQWGWNAETALLAACAALTLIAIFGGSLVRLALRLAARPQPSPAADPRNAPPPSREQRLSRPDGSELRVRFYGPEDAPPIVFTHGWGLHSAEWNYAKRELSARFRLILWDEPGLGESTRPANRDYSLENLARDLEAVLGLAGGRPAILLGHSIGGMITLTFARLFPEALGSRVRGLVLAHTTPINPVQTTAGAAFYSAIQNPVLVPLMYLTIFLSPLVWLMNWLSYLNGSAHLSTRRSSFGGDETWEQVEFATAFQTTASPAVLARGMLGMMRYDATDILPRIPVPALIFAGDRDAVTKPEASEIMRVAIPLSRLVTLSPAKHLGLIEHHQQFADLVAEFATPGIEAPHAAAA